MNSSTLGKEIIPLHPTKRTTQCIQPSRQVTGSQAIRCQGSYTFLVRVLLHTDVYACDLMKGKSANHFIAYVLLRLCYLLLLIGHPPTPIKQHSKTALATSNDHNHSLHMTPLSCMSIRESNEAQAIIF